MIRGLGGRTHEPVAAPGTWEVIQGHVRLLANTGVSPKYTNNTRIVGKMTIGILEHKHRGLCCIHSKNKFAGRIVRFSAWNA